MGPSPKTFLVVNPRSANGQTGSRWTGTRTRLQAALGTVEAALTTGPGEASRLAAHALRSGFERILSLGGDGTHNEVLNGFFDLSGPVPAPLNPEACLGILSSGTGGDFRRTLGIDKTPESWLPMLAAGKTRLADVGNVQFEDHRGARIRRLFLNITSFGLGGLVDQKVNQSSKALGGKISFMLGTLKALLAYRNRQVNLRATAPDGAVVFDETVRINNIAVANGQYFGGGMWIAPKAAVDDGLFDVVILGDLCKRDVIFKAARIYKGTHLTLPEVRSFRASRVEASSEDGEVLIDMDGEQPGRLPITLEVLPAAVRFLVP